MQTVTANTKKVLFILHIPFQRTERCQNTITLLYKYFEHISKKKYTHTVFLITHGKRLFSTRAATLKNIIEIKCDTR